MSNPNEMTEEAIAALRRYADFVQKHSGEITVGHDALREYADRIESAVRRDRDFAESLHLKECIAIRMECEKEWTAKIGNRAAQRKALARIATLAEWCAQEDWREEASKIARDALKEPARNCDKYSIDDIKKMDADFGAFCQQFGAFGSKPGEICAGCPIKSMDNLCCHSAWMLLPEKGGAK